MFKIWLKENWLGIVGFFILMAVGILGFTIISVGFCALFGCGDSCIDDICY